jgi:hypothetical protein
MRFGAVGAALLVGHAVLGCQGTPELGQGGSMVTGSGGAAGSQGGAPQLPHCGRPIGTAALVEASSEALSILNGLGLQSPLPLLRLMMSQSNCFTVVDRGVALRNMEQEEYLKQSGMLKKGSKTARGRMVATEYLITPNVIFSNPHAGGANALSALGGLVPGGAIAGAVAGSMRIQEAQSTLFLTDAQSGVQVGVSEGSARVRDFGGMGGLGGFGGGVAGLAGVGGYGNTAEGKLIAASLLDAYSKLVTQAQALEPAEPAPKPRKSAPR